MCGDFTYSKSDPAKQLEQLLSGHGARPGSSASDLRKVISSDWATIKRLAHQIHDEETSEESKLKRAAESIAALSGAGIINAVEGRGVAADVAAFQFLAKKALDR